MIVVGPLLPVLRARPPGAGAVDVRRREFEGTEGRRVGHAGAADRELGVGRGREHEERAGGGGENGAWIHR